jgi:CheY-like chemotaxis protein
MIPSGADSIIARKSAGVGPVVIASEYTVRLVSTFVKFRRLVRGTNPNLHRLHSCTASHSKGIDLKKNSRPKESQKRKVTTNAAGSESPDHDEVSRTAGHVAHELNNLITVIQINTEFLLESVGANPDSAQELEDIRRASKRASILARQLLASSRREPFDARVAEASATKAAAKPPLSTVEKTPRVAETILLVEDEAAVRNLAKRILSQKGYRVLEASDGAIALRIAASHVGEIDLVLTDVAMPNLGGRGMVEELRELSPDLRVLFMSGYPKDEVFPDKAVAARMPYLQKPFTSETLISQVRGALGYASV